MHPLIQIHQRDRLAHKQLIKDLDELLRTGLTPSVFPAHPDVADRLINKERWFKDYAAAWLTLNPPPTLDFKGTTNPLPDSPMRWYLRYLLLLQQGGNLPPRQIHWIVDEGFDHGKSITTHFLLTHHENTVVLGPGAERDLTHQIRDTHTTFIFDMPRKTPPDWFPYEVMEMIMNRIIQSPKYQSHVTILNCKVPLLIVFSNTWPLIQALSRDRWDIRYIDNNGVLQKFIEGNNWVQ